MFHVIILLYLVVGLAVAIAGGYASGVISDHDLQSRKWIKVFITTVLLTPIAPLCLLAGFIRKWILNFKEG